MTAGTTANLGAQSTVVTLGLSAAGRYQFVGTDHASAGMRGRLVVS